MALNSWPFFLLASFAVLTLPTAGGRRRTAIFLTLNIIFVAAFWSGMAMAMGIGFCLLGYACARLVSKRGTAPLAVSIGLLTAIFVYLRGYGAVSTGPAVFSPTRGLAIAGLSFLFFKMLHVVIDSAGGTIESLPLDRYLNYCLNFTTLLMGPIQRYQDFSAQWTGEIESLSPGFEAHLDAANRALRGLVKAFVIAPYLQPYVLTPGLPIESIGAMSLLIKIYAFYVLLYFDFSGYCDLMIGIGGLMGIRPPENFYLPFFARNVSAYWLRVHRSLTLWLTDYVFTPSYRLALQSRTLGSNAFLALAGSLMLTMLVAGLWHGLTASFAVFGLIHGAALVTVRGYELVMQRWMGRARFRRFTSYPVVAAAALALTYNFTSLAYIFFVLNIHEAVRVLARLTVALTGVLS